jgi:hypothetical protein
MRRGGEVSAEIVLSLAGACQFALDQLAQGESLQLEPAALAAYVAVNVSYQYEVLAGVLYASMVSESPLVEQMKHLGGPADVSWSGRLDGKIHTYVMAQAHRTAATQSTTGQVVERIGTIPSLAFRKVLRAGALTFVP